MAKKEFNDAGITDDELLGVAALYHGASVTLGGVLGTLCTEEDSDDPIVETGVIGHFQPDIIADAKALALEQTREFDREDSTYIWPMFIAPAFFLGMGLSDQGNMPETGAYVFEGEKADKELYKRQTEAADLFMTVMDPYLDKMAAVISKKVGLSADTPALDIAQAADIAMNNDVVLNEPVKNWLPRFLNIVKQLDADAEKGVTMGGYTPRIQ